MNASSLVWLVFTLPLMGAALQSILGRSMSGTAGGKRVLGGLGTLAVFGSFLASVALAMDLVNRTAGDRTLTLVGPDWIATPSFRMPFEWVIDPLSITMMLVITGIGTLIHLYSTGYMREERDYGRFFAYLNLFIASMLILVMANNLPLLFVGWEGVGLCSYLLIGFWYKDVANVRAANKAFVVNRVGDWSLTLGMFLLIGIVLKQGTPPADGRILSYDNLIPQLEAILRDQSGLATVAALLIFGGAAGKSAQFPLSIWLPDAMAGPTPVSALIHAATMVTSGVVLLNRLSVVFQASPTAGAIVAGIGALTALIGALVALGQTDIKKVLAYSTVSQLGLMFIGCGAGAYWTGMFHVVTHAFFKALLFLGAGAVIHAMVHEQDMRRYGKLMKYLPITGATMLIGWLAISAVGVPHVFGFAGFYSKESILGAAFASPVLGKFGDFVGWVGLFVSVLTAFYMTRLTLATFFGNTEGWRAPAPVDHHEEDHEEDAHHHVLTPEHKPREVGPAMSLPLIVLAILSVVGGFFLHGPFQKWLEPYGLALLGSVPTTTTEVPLELLGTGAALLGIVLGLLVYAKGLPERERDENRWSGFRRASYGAFGFDRGVTQLFVNGGGDAGRALWSWLDVGVIEGVGRLFSAVGAMFSNVLGALQRGYVRTYALVMLIGVIGFIGYFAFVAARGGHL